MLAAGDKSDIKWDKKPEPKEKVLDELIGDD